MGSAEEARAAEAADAPIQPDQSADSSGDTPGEADEAWAESLRVVIRQVIASLPDHATLGELIEAARVNPAIAPVLDLFTVKELIVQSSSFSMTCARRTTSSGSVTTSLHR